MKTLGIEGNILTVKFLKGKGYQVLEMNYKTPIGKIDIIAKDGNILVFVEVKTRADNSSAIPTRQCTKERRKKLRNIVLILIYLKKLSNELPIRFNVLSILHREKGKREIEHFKDAIEI